MTTLAPAIALRPADREADHDLLAAVYAGTREAELAHLPFDGPQKDAFVRMQLAAQDAHWRAHRPAATHSIVLVGGEPAGRLVVDHGPHGIHVVDVALLPASRGAGVGSALLRSLLAEADAAGLPVTLYVEPASRAGGLYERLGFRPAADAGSHILLERRPEVAAA